MRKEVWNSWKGRPRSTLMIATIRQPFLRWRLQYQCRESCYVHTYFTDWSLLSWSCSISLDQKLSPVVVARISSLTKLLNHPGVRLDEILNVKAVIEAYETSSLSAESRKSVWVHGKRRPECESDDLNIHALPAGLSYENSGLIWVGDVSHLSFDT